MTLPMISDTDLDKAVLHILLRHVGKAHALDRWTLVEMIDVDPVPNHLRNDDHPIDRLIRASVSRLRMQGYLICDLGDGAGRYMASTPDEFWEFYSYYVKPIKSRATVIREMKKSAIRQFPNLMQPSLFTVIEQVDDWEVV